MESRAHAIAAGLFVVLFGLAIIATLWWFGGSGQEYRYYELETRRSVTGLNPQAAVRFHGVRVGRVLDIDLEGEDAQKVVVMIRVRSEVPITRSTRASLSSQGLTGQAFVQLLDDGSDRRPLEEGPDGNLPRIALSPGGNEQLMEAARDIASQLRETTRRLNMVLSEKNVANIGATLQNVAATTAHLEKTMGQTPALIEDVRRFTAPENAARLRETLQRLQTVSQQLGPAIENWNRTLARVQGAAGRIEQLGGELQNPAGETLGRLNQLTGELQNTSSQLNRVLDDLQRAPQILLLGRQPATPGPGETVPERR